MATGIRLQQWKNENKEKVRGYWRKWYDRNRKEAMLLVGKGRLACVDCGVNDYSRLEINHKYGGGKRERDKIGGARFFRAIVKRERKTKDLELLCRECNMVHYATMLIKKYGDGRYRVVKSKV